GSVRLGAASCRCPGGEKLSASRSNPCRLPLPELRTVRLGVVHPARSIVRIVGDYETWRWGPTCFRFRFESCCRHTRLAAPGPRMLRRGGAIPRPGGPNMRTHRFTVALMSLA